MGPPGPQVYQGLLELNPSTERISPHYGTSISGIIRVEPQRRSGDQSRDRKYIRDIRVEPQQLSSEVVLFHTVYQGLLESNPNDPSDHPEPGTSIPKPIQLLQKFDSVSQRINAHDYSLKARKCKVDDVIFSIYHLLTWIDYPNDRINSPYTKILYVQSFAENRSMPPVNHCSPTRPPRRHRHWVAE